MKFFRKLLYPLNPIYYVVTYWRNKAFDYGWLKSKSYNFPVIGVGNLSVGGTGKSPMIEYLIRLLSKEFQTATLSRGYKRKTTGFKLADASDSAVSIGDEPFQFFSKFKDQIQVAVDENRQRGIEHLKSQNPSLEVVLLDDSFQHRKVQAGFYILLTAYDNIYTDDCMLPAGDLREPKTGAKRADVIVVTKCPSSLNELEKTQIAKRLKPLPHQQVFFSHIKYSDAVVSENRSLQLKELEDFTLVTGIANPKPLLEFLNLENLKFKHSNFPDHHHFSDQELEMIAKSKTVVTTEKDYMRLKDYSQLKDKLFHLPIEIVLDKPKEFNQKVLDFVNSF
ncbi:tetraacyldisaccharide 4'-kinase [Mangrovimonas sp. ST2L15]|uniref:tetraacyldisaccharide 4'-kinase n=1 Tax=Mangrovimonas sp. ST2L15 TaxID=1645916 RepID=UPI0006B677D6|nr:tetraacyldisaccharide 4'-kinase [Mangrovimonas sp. ST2L15]